MASIDDLQQAFRRLEAATPLESNAVNNLRGTVPPPVPITLVEAAAAGSLRRRRGALIGGSFAVAATIVTAVLIGAGIGRSDPAPTPAGGDSGQPVSSATTAPTGGAAAATTAAVPQSTTTSAYHP